MPLIRGSIPNFVQGVSQQASSLRLPSQNELQENGSSSLVEGLMQRPPLDYIAQVGTTALSGAKVHFSSRSLTERFAFVLTNGDLEVYDKDTGVAKTVTFPDGKSYLTTTTPRDSFRLLTIADTTFIVNRETTVAMDTATTPAQDFQALVAVKQGDFDVRYVININGTEVANHVTGSASPDGRSDVIAAALVTDLNTALPTGWTFTQFGSSILIKKTGGASFDISTWDSNGEQNLTVATDRVQRFTDLPAVAPDGFTVEVIGDNTNNFDNYWVIFEADDTTSTVGSKGIWKETRAIGIEYKFDAATMPHTLVKQPDGSFIFSKATWDERLVGDLTSVPDPSFVGETINGLFFFQNRLGLLADDNVIMSQVAGYFNFWPDTAKAVLDSDPIDVAAAFSKVASLHGALAYDKKLLVFSDQSQWVIGGGQILTPANVSMSLIGEYEADPNALPVAAGNVVFFAARRGGFSSVFEMVVRDDTERTEAFDTSEHVPKYLPSGIVKLTASAAENTLLAYSEAHPTVLWVYDWHVAGRQKDQAAWHKFTFEGAEILEVEFSESEAWVVLVKEAKTILARIALNPGQIDTGQTFLTHLDYKMDETIATPVYDAGTDTTTITLPTPLNNPRVVLRAANQGVLSFVGSAGAVSSIVADGNLTEYYVGELYTFKTELSEIIFRSARRDGSLTPVVAGRLQLRTLTVLFSESGYFKLRVTPRYRDAFEYIFTGRLLGQGENVLGDVPISSGNFRVPIQSKSDQVTIELESDSFLPCKFLSAEWEGLLAVRGSRG